MDCGAGDFACYFEIARGYILEWSPVVRAMAAFLTDLFNAAIEAIKPHLQSLIALGSLSFAIWKWVRYREGALFRRLRIWSRRPSAACASAGLISSVSFADQPPGRVRLHRFSSKTVFVASCCDASSVANLEQRSDHEHRPAARSGPPRDR